VKAGKLGKGGAQEHEVHATDPTPAATMKQATRRRQGSGRGGRRGNVLIKVSFVVPLLAEAAVVRGLGALEATAWCAGGG
jgi:hypothetical protein